MGVTEDLNTDGILDLIALSSSVSSSDSLWFFIMPGQGSNGIWDGTFGPPIAHEQASTYSNSLSDIHLVDLNADAIKDVVVAYRNELSYQSSFRVFLGNGASGVGAGILSGLYNLLPVQARL